MNQRTTLLLVSIVLFAFVGARAGFQSSTDNSTPTFKIDDSLLHTPRSLIAYGDTRFTDPSNTTATNPKVRRWLVQQIAREAPDAVLITGDVPLAGGVKNDYAVFKSETAVWRDAHIRIFPAIGNHELHGDLRECLDNWWATFPELTGRRWYSVQLGSRAYVIVLDSDEPLLPGTEQERWLRQQLQSLPASVDFLFFNLHHPPVADVQAFLNTSHNPRPNEEALKTLLAAAGRNSHARFIVTAGHVHNYERRIEDNVVYLVCGGGGAKPYLIERTPGDLYKGPSFPNYHYVKFTLQHDRMHGVMFRVSDPDADVPHFAIEDEFDILAKSS